MTNNPTPITDAALAELDRLHAEAQKTTWQMGAAREIYGKYPALRQRLADAERERDELEVELEEARANSIEYEKDCTKALCSLAREFEYEWDMDGATADDLREFISETLTELQKQAQRLREEK